MTNWNKVLKSIIRVSSYALIVTFFFMDKWYYLFTTFLSLIFIEIRFLRGFLETIHKDKIRNKKWQDLIEDLEEKEKN